MVKLIDKYLEGLAVEIRKLSANAMSENESIEAAGRLLAYMKLMAKMAGNNCPTNKMGYNIKKG